MVVMEILINIRRWQGFANQIQPAAPGGAP
jgi:hypothetical protein